MKTARVLLVEDEEIIRILLAEALSSQGLSVTQAASAEEAWGMLEAGAMVDLVISDITMPGAMDGVELMNRIMRAYPLIKRMIASANPVQGNMSALGTYLPKPYRLETASKLVLQILGPNPA